MVGSISRKHLVYKQLSTLNRFMQVEPDPAGKKEVNDLHLGGGICFLRLLFITLYLLYSLGANMTNIWRSFLK